MARLIEGFTNAYGPIWVYRCVGLSQVCRFAWFGIGLLGVVLLQCESCEVDAVGVRVPVGELRLVN